jgi:hypothetical protein
MKGATGRMQSTRMFDKTVSTARQMVEYKKNSTISGAAMTTEQT